MSTDPAAPTPAPRGGGRWAWAGVAVGCVVALVITVGSWWPGPSAGGTSAQPLAFVEAAAPASPVRPAPVTLEPSIDRPEVPVGLQVPDLGIAAPVDVVGTDPDGALRLPAEPTRLGWYGAGSRPGDTAGSAVIAGHLDSPGGRLGPLAELSRLTPGTEVLVIDAAGTTRSFVVRSMEVVERERLHVKNPFRTGGEAVLTLITCTGTFDRALGRYPANLVVTAVPRA